VACVLARRYYLCDTGSDSVVWLLKLPEAFQAGQNLRCPYLCGEAA